MSRVELPLSPLRVVVADDEKMARKRVVRLLHALGDVEVVAECRSGEEALRHLHADSVHAALLDVDMPGMNGIETARVAALRHVAVIFLTAHAEHAVAAFEEGAVHYLLKPLDAPRLERALDRLRERLRRSRPNEPEALPPSHSPPVSSLGGSPNPVPGRLPLTVRGDVHLVPIADITHALYDGELVTLYTAGREYISDESLQVLAERLEGEAFVRVHRRALLNLRAVDKLTALPSGGYLAVVRGGAEVPVSRQSARELRKQLGM